MGIAFSITITRNVVQHLNDINPDRLLDHFKVLSTQSMARAQVISQSETAETLDLNEVYRAFKSIVVFDEILQDLSCSLHYVVGFSGNEDLPVFVVMDTFPKRICANEIFYNYTVH